MDLLEVWESEVVAPYSWVCAFGCVEFGSVAGGEVREMLEDGHVVFEQWTRIRSSSDGRSL